MSDSDASSPAQLLRRGVLSGVGAGVAGGGIWFLIVLGTTSMTTYIIPALGVGVAYGVHRGMRRPGRSAAVVSVIVTAVTVALSLYYVERHLVVNWFSQSGDSKSIPLVPYLDWMVEVLHHAFQKGPAPALYSVLALVAGGWFGFQGFAHHDNERRTPPARRH